MISTKELCVHYGTALALRNASITVPTGEILAIVGPSGCGKSTFLAALNRMTDLIPGARVSGRVQVGGQDIHHVTQDASQLRRRMGMIFQKPNPFPMSIRRNIQLALREHGERRRNELEAITERVLTDVGLWDEVHDRLEMSALQLSGGQQQRLCIARALALQPQLLLMDEPCSALDPLSAARVESLIAGLRGRYTVVIVTHNLAQARRLADRVAVFWLRDGAGEIIEQGSTEHIFESPHHAIVAEYVAGARG
ncbi:MAG: phosphate ABC transporter ATP-binding protein [Fuerstiella sp.]